MAAVAVCAAFWQAGRMPAHDLETLRAFRTGSQAASIVARTPFRDWSMPS